MILSEFAGAAHSLNGSIIVNPVSPSSIFPEPYGLLTSSFDQWNIEEVAKGIHAAMTVDPDTRADNYKKLSTYGAS